jgi:integrase
MGDDDIRSEGKSQENVSTIHGDSPVDGDDSLISDVALSAHSSLSLVEDERSNRVPGGLLHSECVKKLRGIRKSFKSSGIERGLVKVFWSTERSAYRHAWIGWLDPLRDGVIFLGSQRRAFQREAFHAIPPSAHSRRVIHSVGIATKRETGHLFTSTGHQIARPMVHQQDMSTLSSNALYARPPAGGNRSHRNDVPRHSSTDPTPSRVAALQIAPLQTERNSRSKETRSSSPQGRGAATTSTARRSKQRKRRPPSLSDVWSDDRCVATVREIFGNRPTGHVVAFRVSWARAGQNRISDWFAICARPRNVAVTKHFRFSYVGSDEGPFERERPLPMPPADSHVVILGVCEPIVEALPGWLRHRLGIDDDDDSNNGRRRGLRDTRGTAAEIAQRALAHERRVDVDARRTARGAREGDDDDFGDSSSSSSSSSGEARSVSAADSEDRSEGHRSRSVRPHAPIHTDTDTHGDAIFDDEAVATALAPQRAATQPPSLMSLGFTGRVSRSNAGEMERAVRDRTGHWVRGEDWPPPQVPAAATRSPPGAPPPHRQQHVTPSDPSQGFRWGRAIVPVPAAYEGNFLRFMHVLEPDEVENSFAMMPAVRDGITAEQRQAHLRVLTMLKEDTPPTFDRLPLTTVLVVMLERWRLAKNWVWSTVDKMIGNMIGAFDRLPMYTTARHPIDLRLCPLFRDAKAYTGLMKNGHDVKFPKPITYEQVKRIVDKGRAQNPHDELVFLLIIAWITAARTGCVMQVKRKDVKFNPATGDISVKFVRGKTAKSKQPATVHSNAGRWTTMLFNWLSTKHDEQFLFQLPTRAERQKLGAKLLRMLRELGEDEALEQKSIRRGSLHHLASLGASEELLMHFSTHSSVETLRRYLDFGMVNFAFAQRARALAQQMNNGIRPTVPGIPPPAMHPQREPPTSTNFATGVQELFRAQYQQELSQDETLQRQQQHRPASSRDSFRTLLRSPHRQDSTWTH